MHMYISYGIAVRSSPGNGAKTTQDPKWVNPKCKCACSRVAIRSVLSEPVLIGLVTMLCYKPQIHGVSVRVRGRVRIQESDTQRSTTRSHV